MIANRSTLARVLSFAAALGASACAMSTPQPDAVQCEVSGAQKILSPAGGADGLCASVTKALSGSPASKVDIQVSERAVFTVRVTLAEANVLPELKFAQSDGPISDRTFARLADAVVQHISRTNSQ